MMDYGSWFLVQWVLLHLHSSLQQYNYLYMNVQLLRAEFLFLSECFARLLMLVYYFSSVLATQSVTATSVLDSQCNRVPNYGRHVACSCEAGVETFAL
ncbi:uncharacterized protein BO66DRAFT_243799 [Aspergillus aculeatinus CBS 121060]|uniref:Uncharacterized protein n=1 Tax=Aspergillus aculeatinus CBS 121060 TaxID=1448322 RepID=A0ACD1GSD9_9EURO|nr:hypothetical protein BO66DRAFT_243799 [Aspergillus aculeatinus CBS 121060]RAH64284.1 hypothetical protein BO66DRAFT_243799 [Aspergillus aculeatinus CBS 121060]